jgi:hypothetical protein
VTAPLRRLGQCTGIEAAIVAGSVSKDLIMTTETNSNRPTHRVYAVIIKKEGTAKGAWLEVGAAWPHRDGKGYNLKLDAIARSPDAQLVIRAFEPAPAAG